MSPRVFDVFPLGYETDVLLLRLQTLSESVDEFCIVEGDRTYTGGPRGWLWLHLRTLPEFKPFVERVHWRRVHLDARVGLVDDPWARETIQRGAMLELVDTACDPSPDDLVIVSDADEIPHPDAVQWAYESLRAGERRIWRAPGHYYQQRLDLRAHNSLDPEYLWEWRQPLLGPRSLFKHAQHDRAERQKDGHTTDVPPQIGRGWHFTCMGSDSDIAAKFRAYSHTEYGHLTAEDVESARRGRRALAHGVHLEQVPISDLPAPVRKDPRAWSHMLMQEVG